MNTSWKDNALKLLEDSLKPVPSELNSLDWKSGLSDKSDRWLNICPHSPIYKVVEYLCMGWIIMVHHFQWKRTK